MCPGLDFVDGYVVSLNVFCRLEYSLSHRDGTVNIMIGTRRAEARQRFSPVHHDGVMACLTLFDEFGKSFLGAIGGNGRHVMTPSPVSAPCEGAFDDVESFPAWRASHSSMTG